MKRLNILAIFILLLGIFSACASNANNDTDSDDTATEEITEEMNNDNGVLDDDDDNVDSTNVPNVNEDDEYIESQMKNLNFTEIEIDISYGEDRDFELSIDRDDDTGRYEIEIEDDINNTLFKGREALDQIFPRLETLEITKDSEDMDVIEQVLNAFDLPDDYHEFDIEVIFDDGSRIDFEHRK